MLNTLEITNYTLGEFKELELDNENDFNIEIGEMFIIDTDNREIITEINNIYQAERHLINMFIDLNSVSDNIVNFLNTDLILEDISNTNQFEIIEIV